MPCRHPITSAEFATLVTAEQAKWGPSYDAC